MGNVKTKSERDFHRELLRKVRHIEIRTGRVVTDMFAGAYHSAFKGRGMEFEDVREYQPGDEVRTIDWNVTARLRYPYVKNFREERELTVMLVVDVSKSGLFGSGEQAKQDLIAELGALLAFSAIQNNDKVGLLLFSDRVEKYLAPKKGVSHVLRLVRELLAFEPEGSGTDLSGALAFLGRIHKRRGICFIVSDFITPKSDRELALMAKRNDLIALSVTDPCELSIPKMGLLPVKDLETGEFAIVDTNRADVREQLATRGEGRLTNNRSLLERVGGSFVDIRTDEDYLQTLRACFRLREKRRR